MQPSSHDIRCTICDCMPKNRVLVVGPLGPSPGTHCQMLTRCLRALSKGTEPEKERGRLNYRHAALSSAVPPSSLPGNLQSFVQSTKASTFIAGTEGSGQAANFDLHGKWYNAMKIN